MTQSRRALWSSEPSPYDSLSRDDRKVFLQEQFDGNLWAVRSVLVFGTLFFLLRGLLDYIENISGGEAFVHEMEWRGFISFVTMLLCTLLRKKASVRLRFWAMVGHVLVLTVGICGVTLLNMEARLASTLISLALIYLVVPALWVRRDAIVWTLGLASFAPLALFTWGGASGSVLHSYLFYMTISLILGLIIRHGWLRSAANAFRLRQHLMKQAACDPLTGALNRGGWESSIVATFQGGVPSRPTCLLFFDLDNFKNVNDQHGHSVGDALIQSTVALIRSHLRSSDLLARFGGEEFVALLPQATLAQAEGVARRICLAVAQSLHPVPATVSVGVAELASGEAMTGLIERADQALLRAKQAGKNQVCVSG